MPLTALVPDHPWEAVQVVALVEDQLRVEAEPFATVVGLALRETVGAGEVTETVADCVALPPVPVQTKVYVVLALSAPVACDPVVAMVPDHPPEAVQEVAFVLDQFNVEAPPLATVLGLALSVTVGAGVGAVTATVAACVALPPGPVQVIEYVAFVLRAPVDCEPLTDLLPDQAPPAVHAVALLDDQLRVELLPLLTVLGLALKDTVGAG